VCHRPWWLVVAPALGLACGEGTSRWILTEDPVLEAVDAALSDADVDVAPSLDAGSALAPDAGGRDPELFAAVCSPQVVVDNRTATGRGQLFDQAFPQPAQYLVESARRVCALLYKSPDEVPISPPIVLIIEDFYGIGEIGVAARNMPVIYIRLSSLHMQSTQAAGRSVYDDTAGNLHYLLAIDYELDDENPGATRWVQEGIAAWVRHRLGYLPLSERRAGGRWDDDAKSTGFFFAWLEDGHPDAVYLLNQSLDPDDQTAWSDAVFQTITGKTLATLWSEYQASL